MAIVGFIQGLWVHPGARWVLSGSFAVVVFIRVRFGGRGFIQGPQVHLWSLGSFGCAQVIVGFICGRCVHSGVTSRSSVSFGVVVYIRVPWWSSVHLGLFVCALGVVGFS